MKEPSGDLNFAKICRVCLSEGSTMMSIFKVSVSKKLMACASVQVWPHDGLPTQICNKCCAKLHISIQFKKQCEKSDAKLRQYLQEHSDIKPVSVNAHNEQQQIVQREAQTTVQEITKMEQMDMNEPMGAQIHNQQQQQQPLQTPNSCVFMVNMPQQQQQETPKFDTFLPVSQSQINYNLQPQDSMHVGSYNIQGVGQVQVYNGAFAMPLQTMQTPNIMHNTQMMVPPSAPPLPLSHQQIRTAEQQLAPLPPSLVPQTMQQLSHEDKDNDIKNVQKISTTDGDKPPDRSDGKQCPTCNKVFPTTPKLTRHLKTHSADQPYKCKVCNKSFSHSGNFKIHMRMHTDERPFRCSFCDKGCRQAQDLEKHMRTHTGERPHKCNLCTKAFSTSSNLIAHIRTHTGERPYVCCVCQKAFCQSNELTKHMRTHTGEKSHICDICNRGFNGSSTLIVHRRSHTGERPYVCTVCDKSFAQSGCLAVHVKRHKGERDFACASCDRTFFTNADLKEHATTHESDPDKPYACTACGKKFARFKGLNKHMRTVHPTSLVVMVETASDGDDDDDGGGGGIDGDEDDES